MTSVGDSAEARNAPKGERGKQKAESRKEKGERRYSAAIRVCDRMQPRGEGGQASTGYMPNAKCQIMQLGCKVATEWVKGNYEYKRNKLAVEFPSLSFLRPASEQYHAGPRTE